MDIGNGEGGLPTLTGVVDLLGMGEDAGVYDGKGSCSDALNPLCILVCKKRFAESSTALYAGGG